MINAPMDAKKVKRYAFSNPFMLAAQAALSVDKIWASPRAKRQEMHPHLEAGYLLL